MTEVVAGAVAAGGIAAAVVDCGGTVDVGRSGDYRQSRRIETVDPGSGRAAGDIADSVGDRHLLNSG
jgi:sorbitol-specific phosphotransferase system component IIBC